MTENHHVISDTFNNFFLSITDKITSKIHDNNSNGVNSNSPVDYLFQIYKKNLFLIRKLVEHQLKKLKKLLNHQNSKNSHCYDKTPIQLFLKFSIYQFSLQMHTQ